METSGPRRLLSTTWKTNSRRVKEDAMSYLLLFVKSFFIGIGAIAPGLSGGALAMVFGIYEHLVSAVSHLFTKLKENFFFLATVASGVVVGVVFFAGVQRFLLTHYLQPTMFVFAGLVLGTVPGLVQEGKSRMPDSSMKQWSIHLTLFLLTLSLGVLFAILDSGRPQKEEMEIVISWKDLFTLFLAGFVLAGSLVIPGISGTVLLMLLGFYTVFINAIADLKDVLFIFESVETFKRLVYQVILLIPLGLGVGLGAIVYSRLMEFLLHRFFSYTYAAIIGFVIGSLYELVPLHAFRWNREGILSLIFALIALTFSYQFNQRFHVKERKS